LKVFDNTAADEVIERIAGVEVIFANKVRLTREILDQSDAVRFIGLTATGVDNVDLAAAKEHGVAVCNIKAYCTQSVVEHVFAVLLNLSHSISRYNQSVRAGNWQKASDFCMLEFPLRELSAMTIGIVGHGVLGRGVEKIARQFGMSVLIARRQGHTDLQDLLQQSDVVSLHCPLTDETRGLIGAAELRLMKPNAILINTARGGLVDSEALVDALSSGEISAAAIDVLPQEPPVDGNPLLDYVGDNLIVTPHIAWGTIEARQNAIVESALNMVAFLAGEERNRVV
ncbi:MAG: glycerate dehydrogenase, partial [Gammaproteobacteria bacterium]